MDLHHVTGNTYFINYPSVVGVYVFDDNSCLLIDSGASASFGLKTIKILEKQGLKIGGIINTHFHGDHTGGNKAIQDYCDCPIYASPIDKIFIENPILSPFSIYSAYPLEPLKNKLVMSAPSKVSYEVTGNSVNIHEQEFNIIELSGHTMGQIGIVTPDEVFFAGDAVISHRNLVKFPFLYMGDLDSYLKSLEKLKGVEFPYKILSHDGLFMDDWQQTLAANEQQIQTIINVILAKLSSFQSREQVIQEVINQLDLPINTSQYFLISASISAYLSFLHSKKLIKIIVEDKQIRFSKA